MEVLTWDRISMISFSAAGTPRRATDKKVKTTGVAGGLHKPYKGKGQPRLKAHEKVRQSQHYYGLPPTGGGSLFALAYWLTRKRVGKFFQTNLVRGYVFL